MVMEARGRSHITPAVRALPHRAARLLEHLRVRGAAVPVTSAPWDPQRLGAAVERGPHKSSHGERQFVCEDMLDFIRQGYWIVLPYDVVKQHPQLRLSALAIGRGRPPTGPSPTSHC
jgi:hypothetical protein